MLFIYLLLLFCTVHGLTKRSENSFIRYYYITNSHKHNIYNYFTYLLASIFMDYMAHQSLIAQLIIGGIELNPGPRPQLTHDEDEFFECSAYLTSQCSPLCSIKHKCEYPECSEDIFAACHCDKCNGYGPLLCFAHFERDQCPLSISRPVGSIAGTSTPEEVICNTCFKAFPIDSINLPLPVWELTKNISGKFYYVCKICLNHKDQQLELHSLSTLADLSDIVELPCDECACSIKPQPFSLLEKNSSTCKVISLPKRHHIKSTNHTKTKSDYLKLPTTNAATRINEIPKLLSLTILPPPLHILRKWQSYIYSVKYVRELLKRHAYQEQISLAISTDSMNFDAKCFKLNQMLRKTARIMASLQ